MTYEDARWACFNVAAVFDEMQPPFDSNAMAHLANGAHRNLRLAAQAYETAGGTVSDDDFSAAYRAVNDGLRRAWKRYFAWEREHELEHLVADAEKFRCHATRLYG